MATIQFRGDIIPIGIRLYVKKEDCPELNVKFKKTSQSSRWLTPLVAELSSEFKPPEGIIVLLLFDSYYLCPVVVKAC